MSTQITIAPPDRESPGFGCPACSKPIDFRDRAGIARGRMACCGYVPTAEESTRWLKAAKALDAVATVQPFDMEDWRETERGGRLGA